jgi:hypothetical protein
MEQEVLAILAMVVFGVFVFAAVFRSQEKLDDPNNVSDVSTCWTDLSI